MQFAFGSYDLEAPSSVCHHQAPSFAFATRLILVFCFMCGVAVGVQDVLFHEFEVFCFIALSNWQVVNFSRVSNTLAFDNEDKQLLCLQNLRILGV